MGIREYRRTSCMKRKGVTPAFFEANKDVTCPRCERTFNLFYSRIKMCTSCREAIEGCEFARCPYCDSEFLIKSLLPEKTSARLSNYFPRVIRKYHEDFGIKPGR